MGVHLSQLQRVGVIPDIEATPTLAGLRAGEDEVLATGIEVLRDLVARTVPTD